MSYRSTTLLVALLLPFHVVASNPSVDLLRYGGMNDFDGCTLVGRVAENRLTLVARSFEVDAPNGAWKLYGNRPHLVLANIVAQAVVLNTRITSLSVEVADRGQQRLDGRYWFSTLEPTKQVLRNIQKRLPTLRFFLGKSVGMDVSENERAYYGLPENIEPTFADDGLLETKHYDAAWVVVTKESNASSTVFISSCNNMTPNPSLQGTLRIKPRKALELERYTHRVT